MKLSSRLWKSFRKVCIAFQKNGKTCCSYAKDKFRSAFYFRSARTLLMEKAFSNKRCHYYAFYKYLIIALLPTSLVCFLPKLCCYKPMSHWSHKFMCCKNRWARWSVLKWRNFNLDFVDLVYKASKIFVAVQLRKKQETRAIIDFLVSIMWSLMSPEITESVTGNRIKDRTPIGGVTFLEQLAARHLYI